MAMALPIPELAPVTMAFWPFSGDLSVIFVSDRVGASSSLPSRPCVTRHGPARGLGSRSGGLLGSRRIQPREREAAYARARLARHRPGQRAPGEAAVEHERRQLEMHVVRVAADAVEHDARLALQRHPASLVRALVAVDHDGERPLPSVAIDDAHPVTGKGVLRLDGTRSRARGP